MTVNDQTPLVIGTDRQVDAWLTKMAEARSKRAFMRRINISTADHPYTVDASDLADCYEIAVLTGNLTINLPSLDTITDLEGWVICFTCRTRGGNTLTIDAQSPWSIGGAQTYVFSADYSAVRIMAAGDRWLFV